MGRPEISVIMPVYNVEKYVGKAIESILSQAFADFEFIIVDDGTRDKSGEICDEYEKKDARIRVIHKENGGAPSARNAAIEVAQGRYAYFLDSDDWAEPQMLERMHTLAEENSADLVVCGFFIDTHCKGGVLSEKICVDDRVYENADEFRRESYRYFDRNMLYTPWNKLYRLDEIKEKNLRFPQTLWDDFPFNLSYIRTVERVVVSTEAYYHFIREREDSETSAYRPQMYEKREEEHGWMQGLYEEWGIDSGPVREMVSRRYVERLIGCIENVTSSRCTLTREQKKAQIRKMLKNPRVAVALSEARPKSFYMKLMLIPIRLKSVPLTMLESRVISRVKEKNGGLFARLKAGR